MASMPASITTPRAVRAAPVSAFGSMPTRDVQVLAIADDRRKEREPDHQQDRQRLRPRRGAVQHEAREDAVGNDERDDDEREAGDEDAGLMELVHRREVGVDA